jgi:hypothetical protein
MSRLLEHPAKSAFKRLTLTMPLCQHLLLSMSSTPTSYELSNADWEKGQITQWPPIPYAVSKNVLLVSTSQETVKIKTPKGESKQSLLGNRADGGEYLKHLMSFAQFMEKKGYEADLEAASKVTLSATRALKKLGKVQTREKDPAKAERLTKVEAAKVRLINAKVAESMLACLAYDLFCKLLRDEPEIQWDRIMTDMHTKNPWEDIKGVKHNSLCGKSQQSLTDCIEFHKLTVFTVDAAERLKYYLMCSIKKPIRWTIPMHISRMEVLNKYLGILPTIKNSPLAVATTEMGNVPFTEATHVSIILSHLPVAWRNQYNLMHKTVPKSPRTTLQDLENIEKLFVEKYNEKAQANKAKAATAPKMAERVPKKHAHGGGFNRGAPKKGCSAKYCKWCKTTNWPYTTHNTIECCRFEKDGMPKDKPVKPFDSAKKPWKKTGSGDSSQMAYLTEKVAKLEKKLKRLRSTVRSMLVTCRIVIPIVTRIVGPVARDCK